MNKYRAKEIRHYDGIGDKFIIQKRILGIFWVNCDEVNTGSYYPKRYEMVLDHAETELTLKHEYEVRNVLEWLESSDKHMVFIDKYTDKIIYGITLENGCYYTWKASDDLKIAFKIEKQILEEKQKNRIKHILIYKYNKKVDSLKWKFVKKDGKRQINQQYYHS